MSFLLTLKNQYLPDGSLRDRLARGAYWSFLGAIFAQGLRLLSNVVIARTVGREAFGEYGMVLSSVGMVAGLGGIGLGMSVSKHVAEFRGSDVDQAGSTIGVSLYSSAALGLIAAVLFYVLSPVIGVRLLRSESIVPLLRIGSVMICLGAIDGTLTNALAGFEAFQVIARISLLKGIIEFPIVVISALLWGLPGALAGMVVSFAVACLVDVVAVRSVCRNHGVRIQFRHSRKSAATVVRFGIAVYLGSIITQPAIWGANALLVNQSGGYAEMGIFTAADKWRIATLFLPAAISRIYLPVFSNLLAGGEYDRMKKVLHTVFMLTGFLATVMVFITLIFSEAILGAFGRDFQGNRSILMILATSGIFISLNTVLGQALLSMNKVWERFWYDFSLSIALVLASFLLVPPYKAAGLSMAYLLSFLAVTIGLTVFVNRTLRSVKAVA